MSKKLIKKSSNQKNPLSLNLEQLEFISKNENLPAQKLILKFKEAFGAQIPIASILINLSHKGFLKRTFVNGQLTYKIKEKNYVGR